MGNPDFARVGPIYQMEQKQCIYQNHDYQNRKTVIFVEWIRTAYHYHTLRNSNGDSLSIREGLRNYSNKSRSLISVIYFVLGCQSTIRNEPWISILNKKLKLLIYWYKPSYTYTREFLKSTYFLLPRQIVSAKRITSIIKWPGIW